MNQQDNQSDEQFIAVRVDQLGVEDLNPELPQIQDIVKPFVPSSFSYLLVLNATREIVNGVKYGIIFLMRNEQNDVVYCEIDVLEKPWLVKDSVKFRKMTYNNCSLENTMDNEDKTDYEVNPTFLNKKTQLTMDDIRDMEDQIITVQTTEIFTYSKVKSDDLTTVTPLGESSKSLLDDFFNMNNYFSRPQVTTTSSIETTTPSALSDFDMKALDEIFGLNKVSNSQSHPKSNDEPEDDNLQQKRVENVESTSIKNETTLKNLEIEIKKVFSELFQTDPEFQMNIIALINRKDDSTAQKNYNYVTSILASKLKDKIEMINVKQQVENDAVSTTVDSMSESGDIRRKRSSNKDIWNIAKYALETLDHFDSDDKKRVLLYINSAKQEKGQTAFKIEATVANSDCEEHSHETGKCDERIDLDSTKICFFEVTVTKFCFLLHSHES